MQESLGSIPWSERFAGEGKGYPLQYSGLESSQTVGEDWLSLYLLMYHIESFVYIEKSLPSRDKLQFILEYDPFNMLLNSVY